MKRLFGIFIMFMSVLLISCEKDEPQDEEQDDTQNEVPTEAFDGDGNEYEVVNIGEQYWLKTNLVTTSYNDGTSVGSDDVVFEKDYGNYYKYSVVSNDICPEGWRIPKNSDIIELAEFVYNHEDVQINDMVETNTEWLSYEYGDFVRYLMSESSDIEWLPPAVPNDLFGMSLIPTGLYFFSENELKSRGGNCNLFIDNENGFSGFRVEYGYASRITPILDNNQEILGLQIRCIMD